MIEERFHLDPLTNHDRKARSLRRNLNLGQKPLPPLVIARPLD